MIEILARIVSCPNIHIDAPLIRTYSDALYAVHASTSLMAQLSRTVLCIQVLISPHCVALSYNIKALTQHGLMVKNDVYQVFNPVRFPRLMEFLLFMGSQSRKCIKNNNIRWHDHSETFRRFLYIDDFIDKIDTSWRIRAMTNTRATIAPQCTYTTIYHLAKKVIVTTVSSSVCQAEEQNAKKNPFEDLSREELIKKCKGLLVIAQKAKQAKLDLQTEVESYKNEIESLKKEKITATENIRTLQEFVDSLTEQKLNYITELDAARNKIQSLESSCKTYEDELKQIKAMIIVKDTNIQGLKTELSDLENEVVSLKRQNKRLVDENEHLLNQLSDLESKALEFNEIGLQQREQLRILEENVVKDHTNNILENQESESKKLEEKVIQLEKELASKELNDSAMQNKIDEYDQKLKEITIKYENEKDKKEKANVKLRSYKDKILKCSACINQLKNTRFILSKTVRDYSENIPKWQNDIVKASKILDGQILALNNENISLKEQLKDLQQQQTDLLNQNQLLTNEINDIRSASKNNGQNIDSKIETMLLQIKALESEKATLVKEKLNARDQIIDLENKNKILENNITILDTEYESVKIELDKLNHEKFALEQNYKTKNLEEINELKLEVRYLKDQYELMKKDNENLNDLNGLLKEEVATLQMSLEHPNNDAENLSDLNSSLQADIVKLETKLSAYKQENSSLLTAMKESRAKLKNYESLVMESEEAKSKLAGYKTENAELLNEMKEINQVLKERGETISKQQKAIVEMERLIETLEKERADMLNNESDLRKRLASLEEDMTQLRQSKNDDDQITEKVVCERDGAVKNLAEKDVIISSLLRQHPVTSVELPNDDMSTSTISKADEHARMKDLDDTFEEKYSKLRIFALKLKKRLNEATTQLKSAEEDKSRLEKILNDNMNSASQESKEKNEEICKEKIDNFVTDKINSEVKDYEQKIVELNVSLEALSVDLQKVKADLASKELSLAKEIEEHKNTKDNLEKARRDIKKKNVLSLEMEDYERSMKDLTNKMEENKKKMVQMESTIDSQQGTINAMKTQLKLLEDQVKSEETQNRHTKEELQHALEEIKEKENLIQVKNEVISKLEQEREDEKQNNEEQKIELATLLGEKEKIIMGLCEDKLELNNRLKKLEFKCADLEENQKIRNIELEDLKTEYTSYKVRAQAVLRQNQTVDHSQEEQLKEEMAVLKAQIDSLSAKLTATEHQCSELRSLYEGERRSATEATAEAGRAAQRTARLQADLTRLTAQIESERAHHKLQTSTLTQCYKTQLTELEEKLQKETEELKQQLLDSRQRHGKGDFVRDRVSRNNEAYMLPIIPKDEGSDSEIDINVSMLPREEGEGSESAPSPPPSKPYLSGGNRSPVPLERLLEEGVPEDEIMDSSSLALTPEQELADLRRKLQAQIQRVKHLTVLLAESERDGARHAQMNELLKAEVRRARQALERTQHAHNAEYMKNVTLKFVTLPPGDERSRLVPVLQKILTLSSDETQRLNAVARGLDPNQNRGWGSYLPWGSPK
ncbi:GRIP and coiled-coil domain-containing protein 2 [Eumeta japonica]|uniref:GRIP and coiled-coil domain-containing protein 2 n=1 Tax=Eumeta variegata TaxID=151549 RepID=A0A4C1UAH0_EUMVA|nr:GRIP and coiled-coil domain-containing protein 2 [Eumeta japonica]